MRHGIQSPFSLLCESNEHRDEAKRNRGGVRAIQGKSQTNTEIKRSGIEVAFMLFGGRVNEHRDEAKRNRGAFVLFGGRVNEHREMRSI